MTISSTYVAKNMRLFAEDDLAALPELCKIAVLAHFLPKYFAGGELPKCILVNNIRRLDLRNRASVNQTLNSAIELAVVSIRELVLSSSVSRT